MRAPRDQSVAIALGGLIALATAMGIGRFVYTPILPFMIEGLGLTKSQAGLIASANFLGYLVGALAAASTGLPGKRRTWFLSALAVSGLTTLVMGLTTSVLLFLILRFAGGVASAFVLVFSSALVLDRLAAAGRPGLSSVYFGGVGTGIAASALLIAALGSTQAGWDIQWLASGGISLVAVLVVAALVPDAADPPATAKSEAGGRWNGRILRLIVAYGLFGFGYVITATFISTIVRTAPDLRSIEQIVWLVVGVSAIPSVAFWSLVARRLGYAWTFAAACVVEAVGVALSVVASGAAAILLSAALLGGTFMGITAIGLIYARSLSSGDPRRSLALMTAAFGLGQMIGPSFAGFAFDFGGSFVMPTLVAAAMLTIGAVLVILPSGTRGHTPT